MPPDLSSGFGIELEGVVAAGGLVRPAPPLLLLLALVRAVLAVRLVAAEGRAACVEVGAVLFFGSGVAGVLEVAMDQSGVVGGGLEGCAVRLPW